VDVALLAEAIASGLNRNVKEVDEALVLIENNHIISITDEDGDEFFLEITSAS
jgi:hypothetical protein